MIGTPIRVGHPPGTRPGAPGYRRGHASPRRTHHQCGTGRTRTRATPTDLSVVVDGARHWADFGADHHAGDRRYSSVSHRRTVRLVLSLCQQYQIEQWETQRTGNTKNGNKYLAWAFVEAAHFAIRYAPPIRQFYDRKRAKTKVVIARKAVAHKLARACLLRYAGCRPV